MKRLISVHILLAFLCASTHGIVDHDAGGHKSSVLLPHDESLPTQNRSQHPPMHSTHHHDTAFLHEHPTDAHVADMHTHFTLARFPRSGSTLLSHLFALTPLLLAPHNPCSQVPFSSDDSFGNSPPYRPLYLHCHSFLI
jgi:hypothetical protein